MNLFVSPFTSVILLCSNRNIVFLLDYCSKETKGISSFFIIPLRIRVEKPISFCAQEQPLQLCQFIETVLLYGLVGSLCEEKEEVKFQSRAKLQLHPPPASHLVAMPCLCTISHTYIDEIIFSVPFSVFQY